MAESWRMAFDAAHDGLEAMRDIWPRRRNQIAVSQHDDAQSALRAFESGYSRVATWRKTLPALTSLRPLLASIPEAPADPALNVIVIEARPLGCCV
jgi:hypothetical protein